MHDTAAAASALAVATATDPNSSGAWLASAAGSAAVGQVDTVPPPQNAPQSAPQDLAATSPAPTIEPPGLPAGLQALLPTDPGRAASPAAPVLTLATPVTAPDFSRALAAQLTTLAGGGVQEATLQLNPVDMGPIAVSIVLDGARAQIDFAAAHAQTRQIIEAGLPSLAASLHAAGLTLSGGGVFEQRPGAQDRSAQGDTDGRPGRRVSGAAGGGLAAAEPVVRRQAILGLVDTYA